MRKIVFAYILFQVLFVSCKKVNWDSEIFLCGATINGTSYKDVTTLYNDLFEGIYMPFQNKTRLQIERDSIAYLQFRLESNQEPKNCLYLYGGIAFNKNETFPLLNKAYEICYEPKFNTLWSSTDDLQTYLVEHRDKGTFRLPFGIILIEDPKDPGIERYGSFSLSGTLVFDYYNSKTHQCEGHFNLSNENAEEISRKYSVKGQFKTKLYNNNNIGK